MTLTRIVLTLIGATVLAACSNTRYCARPQPYENATSIPPIVAPEGLKIPTPSTALIVPEAQGDALTYGYLSPDPAQPGKRRIQCLDQPPPIPPLADAAK